MMAASGTTRFKVLLPAIKNVDDYTLKADCKHLMTFRERVTGMGTRLARECITRKLTYSTLVSELLLQNIALCSVED